MIIDKLSVALFITSVYHEYDIWYNFEKDECLFLDKLN